MATHQQQVKNKPLSSLKGLALILGLVVALYCSTIILGAFQRRFGLSYNAASLLFWLFGGVLALLLLQDRVLSYRYTLSGTTLSLDRLYGPHMRHARDILFRMIEDCGDPEEMNKKYPGAHHEKYVCRQCDIPPLAILHVSDRKRYISVIQPDEVIRAALENRQGARK